MGRSGRCLATGDLADVRLRPTGVHRCENFVYVACVPDGSGLNIYEHGSMAKEWMPQVRPFIDDPELTEAIETPPATGRFLHRQFFENRMRYDPKRPWVFGRGQHPREPTKLVHNFYPQPGGRSFLEDFALMMAHGTPEFISWMWYDGSVPFGNEEPMREFAAFCRALPLGKYKTTSRKGGVYVRQLEGKWNGRGVFYAVNTNRQSATAVVPTLDRAIEDLVSGENVTPKDDQYLIPLKPAEMRVFAVAGNGSPAGER